MNKKLILILLCLTSFGTAFTQVVHLSKKEPQNFTESARSKATAGQFESDSDHVNANDIFEIDRTFFSAGYQPALTVGNVAGSLGNMSAFWAMPINDTMTVGIAGEYKMNATRKDTVAFPSAVIPGAGAYDTEIVMNENSSFNIRPVFKWGNFAFSYRIYRSAGNYTSAETKTIMIPSGTEMITNGVYTSGATWEHEIGFAWQTDLFKLYVPVGATIVMNNSRNASHTSQKGPGLIVDTIINGRTGPTAITGDKTQADLYINPEITFPVEIGPITQFEAGIDFQVSVYNPNGASENTTTRSGTNYKGTTPVATDPKEEKTVVTYKDQSYVQFGTYLKTTMEWNTWEDKIAFIFEPVIGFDYMHSNDGGTATTTTTTTAVDGTVTEFTVEPTYETSTYNDTVTPYLEANIGSSIMFTEWFEFRAGVFYRLNWENTTTTTSYKMQDGPKINNYGYKFESQFEVYSGFGFILGEDFFLDVYIAMGNFLDNDDLYPGVTAGDPSNFDLFDIRNYGVQLSYRF